MMCPILQSRYSVLEDGRVWSKRRHKFLSTALHPGGYTLVSLFDGTKMRTQLLHRLVAARWIPNPDNLPEVNHIDGVKSNNHMSNLEWCTSEQNQKHAVSLGLHPRGVRNGLSKLTMEQVDRIRSAKGHGVFIRLAREFGVSRSAIYRARDGVTYSAP